MSLTCSNKRSELGGIISTTWGLLGCEPLYLGTLADVLARLPVYRGGLTPQGRLGCYRGGDDNAPTQSNHHDNDDDDALFDGMQLSAAVPVPVPVAREMTGHTHTHTQRQLLLMFCEVHPIHGHPPICTVPSSSSSRTTPYELGGQFCICTQAHTRRSAEQHARCDAKLDARFACLRLERCRDG